MEISKHCILYDQTCINCGDCDICDLDPNKICDNCCNCLDNGEITDFAAIMIDDILTNVEDIDPSKS